MAGKLIGSVRFSYTQLWLHFIQISTGMSEAQLGYTRRLNAAKLQGTSIEQAEETERRKVHREVERRLQVAAVVLTFSRGSNCQYASLLGR